ncbi:MAG: AsmA family protein, partial [Proteobacteria bacterium]|nr:AsmA family protein [Pseudomonadota bacterium]
MGKVIKIVAGLFVVVMIAAVAVISTVDINQYKPELIEVVEEATGRKLQIGGDLAFALSLVPTVVVEDVQFSNASWGSKPEMLKLSKFEVEVALLPLLSGNIQVNRVILLAPEILLETNKKGMGNWVFSAKKTEKKTSPSESDASSSVPNIVVNEVHIENAIITYKDGVTGQETHIVIDEITAESDSVDDPLSLIMKVAYNEIPIEVKGTLGSLNQLTANDNYPLELVINISDALIELKGQIAKPMDGRGLDLAINFNLDSLSNLSKLAGSELPKFGPISLTAKLSDGVGAYSLKSLALQAGNTDLSGDITVAILGKRPAITANLNSTLIDLAELVGDESQAEAEKKDRLFSSEPLALAALKLVNANVTINVKQIKTSSMVLADTNVAVALKDGNLSIKPLKTLVAGGQLTGNINLNASGKTAVLTTNIVITGLEPNQLADLDGKLTGAKTDVNINVKGSGTSVSQIMADLNGKLLVKVGEGKITDSVMSALGADVLAETMKMLNPFSKSSEGTE